MTPKYKLSYTGLNYFLSSPEQSKERQLILNLLRHEESLDALCPQRDAASASDGSEELLAEMYGNGWLSLKKGIEDEFDFAAKNNLVAEMKILASDDSVMLVDKNGLIIADAGFADIRKNFLAANAVRHILKNEKENSSALLVDRETPWTVKIKWGDRMALAQLLYIGTKRFILILGVGSRINKQAYIAFFKLMARRYI